MSVPKLEMPKKLVIEFEKLSLSTKEGLRLTVDGSVRDFFKQFEELVINDLVFKRVGTPKN